VQSLQLGRKRTSNKVRYRVYSGVGRGRVIRYRVYSGVGRGRVIRYRVYSGVGRGREGKVQSLQGCTLCGVQSLLYAC
jgi:hypothetical protein